MASGDVLFVLTPMGGVPPASSYATLDFIAITGATPDSYIPVLDYDGSAADEHMHWFLAMPSQYSGGGLDFVIQYAMSGTAGTAVQWECRVADFVDDDALATAVVINTQTQVDITDTPIATANDLNVTAAGSLSHANAGSPSAGAMIQVRISRDYDHAANTDDAQFILAYVTET